MRAAFFYGTLMAPEVLYTVIHGTSKPYQYQMDMIKVRPAILYGYKRHKVLYAHYPAILPASEHKTQRNLDNSTMMSVRGTYVTGLSDMDIHRLDIFEGSEYDRVAVQVKVFKDDVALDTDVADDQVEQMLEEGVVDAETYVWKEGEVGLDMGEWDFEAFKKDKMSAWIGLEPSGDVEVDEGFADVRKAAEEGKRDPTGGRSFRGNGHA